MKSYAAVALMTGILAYGASTADAATFGSGRVQLSGRTYNVAACGAATTGNARCGVHVVTNSAGAPTGLAKPINPKVVFPFGCQTLVPAQCLGPNQLRSAYNITGSGNGATVAIVDAFSYPNAESDLANYRSVFGLPPCTVNNGCLQIINQTGGTTPPPLSDLGWDVEQALDLDMVSAMCPNCHILLVEATTPSFRNLATAVNTAAARGAHVISNSYGGGEGGSQIFEFAYNHPGIAVTASTGDSGYGSQFPATSPHVTAVGGTTLNMNGLTRVGETVWAGAGSGCSAFYGQPYWQTHTNTNMANNTLCTTRVEADVSAIADPATGVVVAFAFNGFNYYIVGGTSVAAPLIGGIYGERNDPVVYGRNPYVASPSALRDITSGSNGACGGTYLCTGKVGYDGPTGLGTPIGDSAF